MLHGAQHLFQIEQVIGGEEFIFAKDNLAQFANYSVMVTRSDGVPVETFGNCTFCTMVRGSPIGLKRCVEFCKSSQASQLNREGLPNFYKCHGGLMCCVVPIRVENVCAGYVVGGQVPLDFSAKERIDVERLSAELEIPKSKLSEAVKGLTALDQNQIKSSAYFYNFLAGYIADLCISKLTHAKLVRETKERIMLQEKVKNLDLKRMQAQMSPHFLFNTLNSVARLAMIESAPRTEELICKLAEFLRYSLKSSEELPKLEREIDNVYRYLFIQKIRFGDRLSYRLDIESSLLDYRIPYMTLQPLVENSIIHGLEVKKEGGRILVSGKKTSQTDMIISIIDDGVGFDAQTLELFNQDREISFNPQALGLLNTQARIRYLFGGKYGLKVESIPNKTTSVHVTLPLKL